MKEVLAHPSLYRLWQAPFVKQKLGPVLSADSLDGVASVLDVGCGPGTNAPAFANVPRYVGADISESYIAYARNRFPGIFVVADVTTDRFTGERFDLILLNSLMHHLDDGQTDVLLQSLPRLLNEGGRIHIIDLVFPERGLPRTLAKADRGDYPRTTESWLEIIGRHLDLTNHREFSVGLGPLALWRLIHVQANGSA